MQLSATSLYGWRRWDNLRNADVPVFQDWNTLYLCLLVNETKNPQHLCCGRSIPATHGGLNDSRLGGASSGIVLSPIRRRYRSTTTKVLWILIISNALAMKDNSCAWESCCVGPFAKNMLKGSIYCCMVAPMFHIICCRRFNCEAGNFSPENLFVFAVHGNYMIVPIPVK